MKQDVELLSAYRKSAVGAGLESLDYPAGRLIEQGLTTRYPDHYKVGDGMEGLSDLLNKIKSGLKEARKLLKGKARPFLEKRKYEILKNIQPTYGSDSWYKDKEAIGKPIDVSGLAKLISGFNDFDNLITTITTDQKSVQKGFDDSTKETLAYIAKIEKVAPSLLKMKEDELLKWIDTNYPAWKKAVDELNDKLPEFKHGNATKIDGLTVEQAKVVGKLMVTIIEFGYDIEYEASELRTDSPDECGQGYLFDDFEELDSLPDSLETLFWNCWYWESSYAAISEYAENTEKWCFAIVQQLEKLIVNSIK